MSDYDDMTKDELLAEAKAQGVSASSSMTKAEIVEALEAPEQQAGEAPDLMVTTTRTKDYMGVPLVNATPGTSQATDRLGRSVVAGDKDYLGRALVP